MREEMAAVVGGLVDHACTDHVSLTEDETKRLVYAADIVTRLRTAVERDYAGNVIDAHRDLDDEVDDIGEEPAEAEKEKPVKGKLPANQIPF